MECLGSVYCAVQHYCHQSPNISHPHSPPCLNTTRILLRCNITILALWSLCIAPLLHCTIVASQHTIPHCEMRYHNAEQPCCIAPFHIVRYDFIMRSMLYGMGGFLYCDAPFYRPPCRRSEAQANSKLVKFRPPVIFFVIFAENQCTFLVHPYYCCFN